MRLTRKMVALLAAMSMVAMLSALDQTVVSTALPHILASLSGATLLGWVFTAYFVGATSTVAVVGKLADLFGRRRVFLSSVGLFSVASLLCGVAVTLPQLVAFRGLQGIGAGAIQTCSLIVMSDMFPPRQRARWQVINSIGFATASAVGPSVGGFLADNFSWRWIFLLNVPLTIATVAALQYAIPSAKRSGARSSADKPGFNPNRGRPKFFQKFAPRAQMTPEVFGRGPRPRIDWPGAFFSTVLIVTVLLVCTWGGREFAWTSPVIVGLVAVAVTSTLLLVRAESGAADPVIAGNLLAGAIRALSLIAGAANSMVWFGLILLVPLRLQFVLGASATEAGALLTPGIVLGPLASVAAGQFMARSGQYRVTSWLAGIFQTGGAGLLMLLPSTADRGWIVAGYLLAAAGTGFGGPTFMIAYQNDLRQKQLGAGVGVFSLCRQFGASVSTALAGAIVGSGVSEVGAGAAIGGFVQQAFLLPVLAGVAVLVAALLIPNTPLRSTHHEPPGEAVIEIGRGAGARAVHS